MKQYEIKATIHGHNMVEHYNCPYEWRGSGCYDYRENRSCDITATVFANNEENASDLLARYDFNFYGAKEEICTIDEVEIRSIIEIGEEEDGFEEVWEVQYE